MVRYPSVAIPLPHKLYYGWVIVTTSLLINVATTSLNPVIFSFFIAPMAEDLGTTRGTLAWALTFRLLVSGLTSPFIGRAIDRFGSRWLGVFGGLAAGASLIALGSSSHIWLIMILFGISGAVGLGGGPGGNLLTTVPVAKWFQRRRGIALSVVTVGMASGTVIGIPVAQALIDGVGWRGAWVAFGIFLAVVITPLSMLFMRRSPEDLGINLATADGEVTGASAHRVAENTRDWTVGEALRIPVLWTILGALVLSGVALSGTLVYRVGYWKDVGLSPSTVALGTALDPFSVIFSTLFFGALSRHVSLRVMGLIGCVGFAASMLPMILPPAGTVSIMAHNIAWGCAAGAYITVNNLVWPNYFGRKYLGSIRGVVFPVVVAANAFSAPLYGFLLDKVMPPAALWTISAALFTAGGLLLLTARPPMPKTTGGLAAKSAA